MAPIHVECVNITLIILASMVLNGGIIQEIYVLSSNLYLEIKTWNFLFRFNSWYHICFTEQT